ncbi:hypothetical protein ACOSP7_032989 [Xanthoceras sorbifolium]
MANHYGLPDEYSLQPEFRQLMNGRTHFPVNPQGSESYLFHRNVAPLMPQVHDTIMVGEVALLGGGLVRFGRDHPHTSTNSTSTPAVSTTATSIQQFAVEMGGGWSFENEGRSSRWSRQETLTLLEIRSRLDSKFKEANQKKPLWDEVSRIMAEEHGYYRSEKKCREKFENLYKYYKKTKEGKAGRQDGKHYRCFRQLEALYGQTSNNNQISASESHPDHHHQNPTLPDHQNINQIGNQEINQEALIHDHQKLSENLSVSNTSEFETASSENNIDHDDLSAIAFMMDQKSRERQKKMNESQSNPRVKRSWKAKVKDFVGSQMRKIMESQEAWMERMLKTIEDREQERLFKEEKWRKQEMARFDREHEFWANQRARIEARDSAVMEALQIFTGRGQIDINNSIWTEPETSSLIQIITSLEPQFQENIWEEISSKMASLGYYKNAIECKEKWETIDIPIFSMSTDHQYCNKKHKQSIESMDLLSPGFLINDDQEKHFWDKGKNKQF